MSDQKNKITADKIKKMLEEVARKWSTEQNDFSARAIWDHKTDTVNWIPNSSAGSIQMSTDYDGWTPWTGVYGDYPHIPTPVSEPPKPKCECGMAVTMGKDDQPSYHSDYCPIKKEIKK